jgi:hypothetical protein
MTREEKLWSMTAKTLQEVGEKAGVKITNSDIKKGKAIIIEKILKAETATPEIVPEQIKTKDEFLDAVSDVLDGKAAVKATEEPKAEETIEKPVKESKKANLKLSELTYKGETKSIKDWATEINMPWPTLYDRVNRNGWSVDDAIETPLGQRRPKK